MANDVDRTHYQVLGVAPGASPRQVRDAHRQLARVLHPDRLSGASDAERRLAGRRMREVNVAWTALSDPDRRRDYDRMLRARATGPSSGRGHPTDGSGATGPGSTRGYGAGVDGSGADPRTGRPDLEDPDDYFARLRAAEVDPDEEPLAGWHFWVLRRGPIVAAVIVAVFLFVATAYAGNEPVEDPSLGPTTVPVRECVRITGGRTAVLATCAEDNDGRIVTQVAAALDCPEATSYVLLDSMFTCVTTDPSVVGSPPPTEGG